MRGKMMKSDKYGGMDDDLSLTHPVATHSQGTNLPGHSGIPPGMDKSKGIKSKHTSRSKGELNAHIKMF
jgi:hypothetical protein